MVSHGRMVVQDSVAALRRPTGRVHIGTPDLDAAVGVLGDAVVARDGESLTVNGIPPEDVNRRLVEAGVRVRELVQERLSLEEVFLESTEASVFA
jgi:ABC-2 type transport system ATP-binding protein